MKKGIVILITFIIILIIPINNTYCENAEETLKSQQSEFRINDFIDSAQKYGGEFFEDINNGKSLKECVKKYCKTPIHIFIYRLLPQFAKDFIKYKILKMEKEC